jgi:peptide/nickel transport system substrate-binding protein
VDRSLVSEAVTRGVAPIADSVVPPNYAIRQELESAIAQYPFDLAAAERALQELGWARAGDGIMRDAQGQPMRFTVRNTVAGRSEKEQNSAVAGWKQLGIQLEQLIEPSTGDEQERARHTGVDIVGGAWEEWLDARVSCRSIPAAGNGWRGRNSAGWCYQPAQDLIDQLQVTIPPDQRLQQLRGLVQVLSTQLPNLPIYWDIDSILAVEGIRNLPMPSAPKRVHTWNVWEWDRD